MNLFISLIVTRVLGSAVHACGRLPHHIDVFHHIRGLFLCGDREHDHCFSFLRYLCFLSCLGVFFGWSFITAGMKKIEKLESTVSEWE